MSLLALNCWARDDTSHAFTVEIQVSKNVSILKDAIKEKKQNWLGGIDANRLEIWKLKDPMSAKPSRNLAERIQELGELTKFADELEPTDRLSDIFPQQPPRSDLHIIISVPAAAKCSPSLSPEDGPAPKKFYLKNIEVELKEFWERVWGSKQGPIVKQAVHRDPEPISDVEVPQNIDVLCGLPGIFGLNNVLIREEYVNALAAVKACEKTHNTVVVVGHPGIGVKFIPANDVLLKADLGTLGMSRMWALVDNNQNVKTPAMMFVRDHAPIFLVIASLPQPSRWANADKRSLVKLWFMKSFTLAELIQARHLQDYERSERQLQQFFELYGPSARDCYQSCADLEAYNRTLLAKVQGMNWASTTAALTAKSENLGLDEGSHKVILIEPDSDDRASHRSRIVTKNVARLLSQHDSNHPVAEFP